MEYVSGEILIDKVFEKGYIGFEKKKIVETGKGLPPKKPISKGIILPTFVNAHTHIGDSFIRKKKINLPRNVEQLVAPPYGLKHRLLNKASDKEIINGMKDSINTMKKTGVNYFCDFRENGIIGINQLKKAVKNKKINSFIFSRPVKLRYSKNEIDLLLDNSIGIGLSSISDWDFSELKKIAVHTKKRKKLFAIHANERIRENIDFLLDLKPDFLIHMIYATESDLERVKNEDIPIIICPRSNMFYGLKPNFKLLKKRKINLLIGTDNAMLNSPSIIDEIKFLKTITKEFSNKELIIMPTYNARKALNWDGNILGANSKAEFVVLDKKTMNPLYISI